MKFDVLKEEFLEIFFPTKCSSCGKLLGGKAKGKMFCAECFESLGEAGETLCRKCKEPVYKCNCVITSMSKAGFSFHVKLFRYMSSDRDAPANRVIYKMKDSVDKRLYSFLAKEIAERLNERVSDAVKQYGLKPIITYIPRSPHSVRKYGSDQAKFLAAAISEQTGIPMLETVKRRKGKGREMKKLNYEERRKEGKTMFFPKKNLALTSDNLVIAVDDIVTSGSSMTALAETLNCYGVLHFGAVSVGLTY